MSETKQDVGTGEAVGQEYGHDGWEVSLTLVTRSAWAAVDRLLSMPAKTWFVGIYLVAFEDGKQNYFHYEYK